MGEGQREEQPKREVRKDFFLRLATFGVAMAIIVDIDIRRI